MSELIGTFFTFLPLLVLVLLANLAERERRREGSSSRAFLALLAYGSTAAIYLVTFAAGIALQGTSLVLRDPATADGLASTLPPAQLELLTSPLLAFGLWFPSVVGLVLLLPAARRLFGRLVSPFNPSSHVHAIALSLSMLILIQLLVTLGIGLDTLTEAVANAPDTGGDAAMIGSLWVQNLMLVLIALLGVGWATRRDWRGAIIRLKLKRPSWKQVGAAFLVAFVMVPFVAVLSFLGEQAGIVDADVEALTEELLGGLLLSVPGILTIGLAAGIGEEILFRGAIQPKFGRIMTAALFAILHGNYGFSLATLAVFILGYVLGVVRDRANTTTAVITHAVYNMTLGVMAYIGATMSGGGV